MDENRKIMRVAQTETRKRVRETFIQEWMVVIKWAYDFGDVDICKKCIYDGLMLTDEII